MAEDSKIEKLAEIALLLDFYGGLLTEKQQRALALFYDEDLTLAEIAAESGVSRQAVYDLLRHGEQQLRDYESRLQLAARHQQQQRLLRQIAADLRALRNHTTDRNCDARIDAALAQLIEG
ncbi:MAG: sigma factor-like helix-turn-helix DNA-binding protein [Bacillota bacterium]|nr:sigma factor-like helix-turn-helix DNA-binding protein [Bacillota bacterium]